jgi:predicted CXXCH cytochrome family protein
MRPRERKPEGPIPNEYNTRARLSVCLCFLALVLAAASFSWSREAVARNSEQASQPATGQVRPASEANRNGYVGSRVCAQCHAPIANKYSRTDMGRSMSEITPALLEKIPTSTSFFDDRTHRHFAVHADDGKLFQSEYEIGEDDKEEFRETHPVDWIIGAGANGFGALIRRGDFLFEAPLSFYSKAQSWALSPGYEFGDYGFNRPILAGCIACHSGRPQAVLDGNGKFLDPPFLELAIGCENCHGPGAAHLREMREGDSSEGRATHSIVNPAKLKPWLADNICMSCHQTGDAMVLKPGRDYRDFTPGAPLDDTLAIFMVPPRRDSPQTDLLEHYFSMTLSKCFRSTGGRLSCITCHDPHVEPAKQDVPAYYRQKCLGCHTEKSCALPLGIRERKAPPDDCAGCHMPKREVPVIAHAVLTNHRIVAQAEEPYPDAAFHMTTPQLPDLVHLSAIPGQHDDPVSPTVLLQAYGQSMAAHPEYRAQYFALAKQLEATDANNVDVLEALAALALEQNNNEAAMQYLNSAVRHNSASPQTYEQLAILMVRAGRYEEAVPLLERGIQQIPYDATLYRLLGSAYLSLHKKSEATVLLQQAAQIFPQDATLRKLLEDSEAAVPTTNTP